MADGVDNIEQDEKPMEHPDTPSNPLNVKMRAELEAKQAESLKIIAENNKKRDDEEAIQARAEIWKQQQANKIITQPITTPHSNPHKPEKTPEPV